MGSEHLADSQIQGYLAHKIRLGAPGWSNIEIGLSEGELLDKQIIYPWKNSRMKQLDK
jgi:hypothetical protein